MAVSYDWSWFHFLFNEKVGRVLSTNHLSKERKQESCRESHPIKITTQTKRKLVPSAEKKATGAKRGKKCSHCLEREKWQRGKAREDMQPAFSAGKHVSRALRGKMKLVKSVQCNERENV